MSAERFDITALDRFPVAIKALTTDSRRVQPGDVFLAYPGLRADGRQHIAQAIERGAAGVIWDPAGFEWNPGWHVPQLSVPSLSFHLGELAAHVYRNPSAHMWVAGVTGTNGKTSCSHWISHSLNMCGRKTALIGTLGSGFPDELDTATHTTPDAVSLQRQLRRYADQGAQAIAMEVSSHGLDQRRVAGIHFDTALFTNLTRDHLDYHGTMARYGEAKAKLFHWPGLSNAVINLDDSFGQELVAGIDAKKTRVLGYGVGKGEISGHAIDLTTRGLKLEIRTPWGKAALQSRLLGGFNVSNLLGTLGVLLTAGINLSDAIDSLSKVEAVPGRLEMLRLPGAPLVVVDYAHTPDALEKVLETLREVVSHTDGARLICVFGCGGDRDPGKRPIMGEIATRLSDLAVITSDNPRSESPMSIIEAIVAGSHANYEIEADRANAILHALRGATSKDVVLIAGKGHETYQEIAGQRTPFNDLEVAREVIAALGRSSGGTHV